MKTFSVFLMGIPALYGQAAFIGAQGSGAVSVGGRGGTILQVTNLNNSGAGSFRAAVEASGARIVVFRIAGVITLTSQLQINNPFLTVAGQTAPGPIVIRSGPALDNDFFRPNTNNLIFQYIAFRVGENGQSAQLGDAVANYSGVHSVIFDHCSFSWSKDEIFQVWGQTVGNNHSITVSNSIMSEPLDGHAVIFLSGCQTNACAAAMGAMDVHHSLWANFSHRGPLIFTSPHRLVNNIIYNWAFYASQFIGGIQADVIGNLYKAGPLNPGVHPVQVSNQDNDNNVVGTPGIYLLGNIGPQQSNPGGNQWLLANEVTGENGSETGAVRAGWQRASPLSALTHPITVTSASTLEADLTPHVGSSRRLNASGAWFTSRDSVDTRILAELAAGTGFIPGDEDEVGGFPTIAPGTPYTDSDNDGMPNTWESANGLNPNSNDSAGDSDSDGYTNIEEFLAAGSLISTPIKIMPMGDSITVGHDVPGGYRTNLKIGLDNLSYNTDLVGSGFSAGPGPGTDWEHEGHAGWNIQQISDNVVSYLVLNPPNAVLLMIGTNDIVDGLQSGAPTRLSTLVDQITTQSPTAEVFVASIGPLVDETFNNNVNTFNAAIPGMVAAKQSAGKNVRFVDINSLLTTADLNGTIHPSPAGYAKIADGWLTSIEAWVEGDDDTAPTVTTSAATSITATSATGNGNVTADGGAAITQRGVCWSTTSNPATAGTCNTSAGTTGAFSASMTSLSSSTLYHYRAYAINSVGTSYGVDTTFTTIASGTRRRQVVVQ